MAETIVGAMLSAVLEAVVENLASPEVLKFFGGNSTAEALEKLNVTLWSANKLLNDAEDKQVVDSNVKSWVDMLNHLLSEAEDVVDEINTRAASGPRKSLPILGLRLGRFDDAMVKRKIEKLIAKMNFLLDQKDRLGLKEGVRGKRLLERSPAPLIGCSSEFYGREDDKEAMIRLLFTDDEASDEKIYVVPVVGMGGVGKTTLARMVYNDDRVKERIEHRAWVTVSDDFDVLRLAKLVFEGLAGKKSKSRELGELGEEMGSFLSGKSSFLVVLDDVWNEKYNLWNALKSCLSSGSDCRGKVIVTTRSEIVASRMGGFRSHLLHTLSNEDCWRLFKRHAFRGVDEVGDDRLEEVGKKIVDKCKGLPLAVMSLAGFLSSVSDPREWEEVLRSEVWDSRKRYNDEIVPSLWLSYTYLPSHLKRCFAYCSIFPKDHKYEMRKIVLLWMAEGILQGENMEDVGEEYFNALISRSLLQRCENDESNVVMHDLVHDLATFVLGKGFCVRLGEGGEKILRGVTTKTRHFLYDEELLDTSSFEDLCEAKCLRTYLATSQLKYYMVREVNYDILAKNFRFLRVLCLSYSSTIKLQNSIGKLKHLRYLDLSYSRINKLPDTICSLFNLQTLLLNGCSLLTALPAKMGNLKNLRYLDLSRTDIRILPDTICSIGNLHTLLLNQCAFLAELPPEMGSLVNLRHLDISDTPCLKNMSLCKWSLEGLRTLSKLVLNDKLDGSKLWELKKLSHYRPDGSLEIVGLENIVDVESVLDAEFEKKSRIGKLTLKWRVDTGGPRKDREILDALKPHANLKRLSIEGYGGTELSDWVADGASFSHITELRLVDCTRCSQLPIFGPLHSLRELYIIRCPQMRVLLPRGGEMDIAFPSLSLLCIQGCSELDLSGFPLPSGLKWLEISECKKLVAQRMQWGLMELRHLKIVSFGDMQMDSFPEEGLIPETLKSLEIEDAPNLKALNGKGLQHLASLDRLKIAKCPKLECLPEQGLPASLSYLEVRECGLLEPRLKMKTGLDWHKVSLIRVIRVACSL